MTSNITSNQFKFGNCSQTSKHIRLDYNSSFKEEKINERMSTLPIETLENIACYLPDKDLRAFGQADSACRNMALRERTLRVLTTARDQVGQLSTLNPTLPNGGQSSLIRWYKNLLVDTRQHELNTGNVVLPRNEQVLESLNQSLRVITTEQLADRVLGLKNKIFKDINDKNPNWDDIDKLGQELQLKSLVEALNAIIGASVDAGFLRGSGVVSAAGAGHLEIVRDLLANGPISELDRFFAVWGAAGAGHLEIVKALIINDAIDLRRSALLSAALKGHLNIVEALLADGSISDNHRGLAVQNAASEGHLNIVNYVLAYGPISEMDRVFAVRKAARGGHLEIVQALLANGNISFFDRCKAIQISYATGHYKIAFELLPAKAILATAFLGLTASYITSLQYQDEQ